jgi:hypothetical protein
MDNSNMEKYSISPESNSWLKGEPSTWSHVDVSLHYVFTLSKIFHTIHLPSNYIPACWVKLRHKGRIGHNESTGWVATMQQEWKVLQLCKIVAVFPTNNRKRNIKNMSTL